MSVVNTQTPEAEAAGADDDLVPDAAGLDAGRPGDDRPQREPAAPENDGAEEIDLGGEIYRAPKAVTAEVRRLSEALQDAQRGGTQRPVWPSSTGAQAGAGAAGEGPHELGQLALLDLRLAEFERMDLAAIAQEDPNRALTLSISRQETERRRDRLVAALRERHDQQRHDHEQAMARQAAEAGAVLRRDIPGWSRALAGQVSDFGQKQFGFSAQEIAQVTDPRVMKVLHLAMRGHEADAQARAEESEAQRIAATQRTAPAQMLRGRSARTPAAPDTNDFAAFESLADERMRPRR